MLKEPVVGESTEHGVLMLDVVQVMSMVDRPGLMVLQGKVGVVVVAVVLLNCHDRTGEALVFLEEKRVAARGGHVADATVGSELEEAEIVSTLDNGETIVEVHQTNGTGSFVYSCRDYETQ